jgi:K+-transporting ATPase ATPase C chain
MPGIMASLRLFLGCVVLCGLLYTSTLTLFAQVIWPWQAGGSLLVKDKQVTGSLLLGQPFATARYFHGRPSAADYDPAASGGSNWGPTSKQWREALQQRLLAVGASDANPVPADLIMASGSGLDPHITPDAARFQIPRVAKARHRSEEALQQLVKQVTEKPVLRLIGAKRVNVLQLNLALDALDHSPGTGQPP